MKKCIVFILCILLTACSTGRLLEDISESQEYSPLVNRTVRTMVNLQLALIRPIDKEKKPYYKLIKLPGGAGPEFIESSILQAGALLNIKKVLVCTNCFLDSDPPTREIELIIENSKKTADSEVRMTAYYFIWKRANGTYEFDLTMFEPV